LKYGFLEFEIGQNWGLQGLQDAIQDDTSNCENFKHETTWQNGKKSF
jgi:hypothetical protein